LEHSPMSGVSGVFATPAPAAGTFAISPGFAGGRIQANTRLRNLPAEALGKPAPNVRPTLLAALKDGAGSVREGAVQALGLLGPAAGEAIPALARGLHDPDGWVRLRSVEALTRVGRSSPVAQAALIEALGHKDTMVRRAAVQALAPAAGR